MQKLYSLGLSRARYPTQYGGVSTDTRKVEVIGGRNYGHVTRVYVRIAKGETGAGKYYYIEGSNNGLVPLESERQAFVKVGLPVPPGIKYSSGITASWVREEVYPKVG